MLSNVEGVSTQAVASSEGGMIILPTYLLQVSKRFLTACRTRQEGRADNLKIENRHGDKRYRLWLARPQVEDQVCIETSMGEWGDNWIVAHRFLVK